MKLDRPNVHKYIRELNDDVLSSKFLFPLRLYQTSFSRRGAEYKVITVGETPFTHDAKTLIEYVLPANRELQMIFTFEHMDVDGALGRRMVVRPPLDSSDEIGAGDLTSPMKRRPFDVRDWKEIFDRFQNDMYRLGGWNSL